MPVQHCYAVPNMLKSEIIPYNASEIRYRKLVSRVEASAHLIIFLAARPAFPTRLPCRFTTEVTRARISS